jgi:hypothetical protein
MWFCKKKVTFNNKIFVYIIPSFYNDLMREELWWSRSDFILALNSCDEEIRNLINIHPNMDFKCAKKLLYQPNNICYDANNFEEISS